MKTDILHTRIDPRVKTIAIKAAKADGRSLSSWIEQIILLAAQQVAPPPAKTRRRKV